MMPVARKEEGRNDNLRSSVSTVDFSDRGLQRIEPLPDGISPQTVLYNCNNISRVENLQYFAHLQQLSLANNHLVEMKGISQAQGLRVLDLSNNSIITIEGLTHLRSLEWLNLSGNSIKRMQNLEKNINLYHLDVSDNSITKICNLRSLTKLKILLLHGNLVSSLRNLTDSVYGPSVVTLSLAENEISDLNEITNLKQLPSLEQLSIAGNPCLLALSSAIGFNYRPFILFHCPKLHNLDAHLISQADRLECEKLRNEGQLRTFSSGRHLQLVKYLTQATPVRQSKTPTPTIDSISCSTQAGRWLDPVLDDKPSTQDRDLAMEDISDSEFSDDQLVSESCYLPITISSIVSATGEANSDDWFGASQTVAHNNQNEFNHRHDVIPEEQAMAIPVDNIFDEEKGGDQPRNATVPVNQEEGNPPLLTEEEALNLIHLAATIIQAHVRGFLARTKLNFYEYRHKKRAAVLIQAVWRGYRTRVYNVKVINIRNEIRTRRLTAHVSYLGNIVSQCQEQATRDKRTMAKAIKCLWSELEKQNSRYVTWLQHQQNRAALKIQRFWRGYRVRQLYPRPKPTRLSSYQDLAMLCQSLQKQIDLLTMQVEDLKSAKSHHDDKTSPEEPPDSSKDANPSRSIPGIRIIRPSVCILPELQLDASTKEHLKQRDNILDDVDVDVEIEPLDIGDYDGDGQELCNTTFDVETSALETRTDARKADSEVDKPVDDTEYCSEEFDSYSKDFVDTKLVQSVNTENEDFGCDHTKSKEVEIATEPDPTPVGEAMEQNESPPDPADSYESESSNEDLASTVKKVDMNITEGEFSKEPEEKPTRDSNAICGKRDADSNASVTDCVTLEPARKGISEDPSEKNDSILKEQREGDTDITPPTSPPSTQEDASLSSEITDDSVSDTSSSSPSKPDTGSGKKKKKLLLRSTSADRLRMLHSSPSLDSQQLSSSLNFDTRLSQRSASLLRELRTEIASLTVRQLSDTDYFENEKTIKKSADSTENGQTHAHQSCCPTLDTFSSGSQIPRDEREFPESNRDDIISENSEKLVAPSRGEDGEERASDSETMSQKQDDGQEVHETSQPSTRQTSFSLPAFEDVDASLSMEDLMNDSLEEHEDF